MRSVRLARTVSGPLVAALALGLAGSGWAQSPAPSSPPVPPTGTTSPAPPAADTPAAAAPAPATTPASPATPAPLPSAQAPAAPPSAAPATPPATPPAAAQAPAAAPASPPASDKPTPPSAPSQAGPAPTTPATPATPATPPAAQVPEAPGKVQTADPFGEETVLAPKQVVAIKGTATWDNAFETLVESLRTLTTFLDKQGIKASGPYLIVYTSTDDNGFTYLAEIPVDREPKSPPKSITVTKSPEGKALKFVHRGSYDNMDNTYEAITNHLDERRLEAKDTFIEEYTTDPLKTEEDKLVINVFVPLK